MAKIINLALRTWELICAIIVMSLVGNMIASAFAGDPATVNYTMFTSAFAMVSLPICCMAAFSSSSNLAWVASSLDSLNTILWLCAGIALAAKLEVHSCDNHNYLVHNEITNGAHNMTKRCREAQASDAFLWFGFAAFAVSTFMSVREAQSGPSSTGRASTTRPAPPMAEV